MKVYEGRIEHNKETICRMFGAAYYKYEFRKVLIRLCIGILLTIAGLVGTMPLAAQGIMIMIGCWLIISWDFPSKCRADRVLGSRKQTLPVIKSIFYENHMELNGEGKMNLPYDKFQCLLDDKGYYFLFLSKDSVCMIDAQTLKPDEPEKFKQFITSKTKLEWKQSKTLFSMGLSDLIYMLKK